MKKDKRGLAMITAIAVLALMLILFGGLASVYSAQVSRGKVELEQSQAMLMAQSYAEMLDQVLTSNNGEADDLKEALGSIRAEKEVEIKSDLTQPENVIDAKVKITAMADKATVSGNTTTRKIKIKVSATVDDETRSIDLDYTFKKVTGGGVMDYAVYGNTVDFYKDGDYDDDDDDDHDDDDERQAIKFSDTWYYRQGKEELYVEEVSQLNGKRGFKYGLAEEDKVFQIMKDTNIDPITSDITMIEYDNFALGVNKENIASTLPLWSGLSEPDEAVIECTNEISTNCIWSRSLGGNISVKAMENDITIYIPVNENLELKELSIFFDGYNSETGELNQLYIYIYKERSNAKNNELTIESSVKLANLENHGRSEFLDIFVICNDEINVNLDLNKHALEILEAYFYFPKGTILWEAQTNEGNYKNQIRGCLIANKIVIFGDDDKKFNQVGVDYVPPREIQGGGSSKTTFTYKLNSYNEGGKS